MILRIVTRPECWDPPVGLSPQEGLNLPGSIPAHQSLEKQGASILRFDQMLEKKDYEDIWRESFMVVWKMIGEWEDRPGLPHLFWIYSYSLYLLVAQIMVLARFLDRVHDRWGLREVQMEDPASFAKGDYLFFEGVYSGYYSTIAHRWAIMRSVPIAFPKGVPSTTGNPGGRLSWKFSRFNWRFLFRRLWNDGWMPLWQLGYNLVAWVLGQRRFILFLPSKGGGMHSSAPPWAVNVQTLRRFLFFRSERSASFSPAVNEMRRVAELAMQAHGGVFSLVSERLSLHLHRNMSNGWSQFFWASSWLKRFKRWGIQLAYQSASVYVDWTGSGFIAEAFRQNDFLVAGVQHGGNTRLARTGGTPTLFAEYGLCDMYFQWGKASLDEHIEWGLKKLPRVVMTGSPRFDELRRQNIKRRSLNKCSAAPKILYAPTLFGIDSTLENNISWDRYLLLFHRVCEELNAAPLEVLVKLAPREENRYLGMDRYPRLRIVVHGGFSDYMAGADLLVADSLGGSPIYEALATTKPLLLYTGSEMQEWDKAFVKDLSVRARCCFSSEEYLEAVKQLAADPERFLKNTPSGGPPSLAGAYFPNATSDHFWTIAHNAFFGDTRR